MLYLSVYKCKVTLFTCSMQERTIWWDSYQKVGIAQMLAFGSFDINQH